MARKSNDEVSLNNEIEIHGVKIKKMPNGKYFEAMKLIKDLPQNFIDELPEELKNIKASELLDAQNIIKLIGVLTDICPNFVVKFIAKLLDINEKTILETLTPKQTIEILRKFYEINELESFFQQLKPIKEKALILIGFKKQ